MEQVIYADFETVDMSVFSEEVMDIFADADPDKLLHYIRQTAIYFAERTQVLTHKIDVPIFACAEEHKIPVPEGHDIISVYAASYQGNALDVEHKVRLHPDGCSIYCGTSVIHVEIPDQLFITPPLQAAGIVTLHVSLRPSEGSCAVDARLYRKYRAAIVSGAVAKLAMLPAHRDVQLATAESTAFERMISSAGVDRLIGVTRGPYRYKSRRYL